MSCSENIYVAREMYISMLPFHTQLVLYFNSVVPMLWIVGYHHQHICKGLCCLCLCHQGEVIIEHYFPSQSSNVCAWGPWQQLFQQARQWCVSLAFNWSMKQSLWGASEMASFSHHSAQFLTRLLWALIKRSVIYKEQGSISDTAR